MHPRESLLYRCLFFFFFWPPQCMTVRNTRQQQMSGKWLQNLSEAVIKAPEQTSSHLALAAEQRRHSPPSADGGFVPSAGQRRGREKILFCLAVQSSDAHILSLIPPFPFFSLLPDTLTVIIDPAHAEVQLGINNIVKMHICILVWGKDFARSTRQGVFAPSGCAQLEWAGLNNSDLDVLFSDSLVVMRWSIVCHAASSVAAPGNPAGPPHPHPPPHADQIYHWVCTSGSS